MNDSFEDMNGLERNHKTSIFIAAIRGSNPSWVSHWYNRNFRTLQLCSDSVSQVVNVLLVLDHLSAEKCPTIDVTGNKNLMILSLRFIDDDYSVQSWVSHFLTSEFP